MTERERVADFWDDALARWCRGGDHMIPPLAQWMSSYAGKGKGAVDLSCYPDPYVGDLRGETYQPRLVVLGLNPGQGHLGLQGHDGIWTRRIRDEGYSRALDRSPAADPVTWKAIHGKESPYWRNLIRFGRRWFEDESFGVHDILNFELYPWHSDAVTAPMVAPAQIIETFVWAPCRGIDAPLVFAFGAPWFGLCEALGLPEMHAWGQGGTPFPMEDDKGWRMRAYRLSETQTAVVSAQPGYSGPPGPKRLSIMRNVLSELLTERELPPPPNAVPVAVRREQRLAAVGRPNAGSASHEAVRRRMMLALETVAVLHRRGYQHLRVVSGMNGSGLYWRCSVTASSNLTGRHGVKFMNYDQGAVHWSNAAEGDVFGIAGADALSASQLADSVLAMYPEILTASRGSDWAYAGWYIEMLGHADNGFFPVFYADYLDLDDGLTRWAYDPSNSEKMPVLAAPPRVVRRP